LLEENARAMAFDGHHSVVARSKPYEIKTHWLEPARIDSRQAAG
jgi:hypothetical protein